MWPASSSPKKHHHYVGGLSEHTLEVVNLCLDEYYLSKYEINRKEAYLAALFHDYGKIYDYEPWGYHGKTEDIDSEYDKLYGWKSTQEKLLRGHIVNSAEFFMDSVISSLDCNCFSIQHAILAHHGRKEWGSPVTPQTPLAWLLHLSDTLSARMSDGFTYES